MTEHTPKPWIIAGNLAMLLPKDGYRIDTEHHAVARTITYNQIDEEAKANARLIAAAPDLYEAAKRFVSVYQGRNALRLGDGQAQRSLEEFRAAVAKAEGVTS